MVRSDPIRKHTWVKIELGFQGKPAMLFLHLMIAVDVKSYFLSFARESLTKISSQLLQLALYARQVGSGCMVLMVAVIYKGKALPLAWLTYPEMKRHTTAEKHIAASQMISVSLTAGGSNSKRSFLTKRVEDFILKRVIYLIQSDLLVLFWLLP